MRFAFVGMSGAMGKAAPSHVSRVIALQALMVFTFVVVEARFIIEFRGSAPVWAIATTALLVAAHAVYALVRIALLASGRRTIDSLIGRALLVDESIVLGATVPILAVLWLLCPWAGSDAAYAYIVACTVACAGLSIGSIARPPAPSRRFPAAILIPLGSALYLLVHRDIFAVPVAVALASLALGIAVTRPIIERILSNAHEARRAIESAYAALAEGRDARTRFVAAASHDLGQPVQAARLFLEQAMAAGSETARSRAALKAQEALDSVSALATGMLEYLRLDAQDVHARSDAVALGPVIARVAERCEARARRAGSTIVALSSSRAALGDEALIERCLTNLVVNAARHAKARRILVGLLFAGRRLRIMVIDDGVGVAEEDRERLFGEFAQGREAARVGAGFGLGLSSSQRIAALMNGSIGYRPGARRGSAFWIELGRARDDARPGTQADTVPDAGPACAAA